jgi:hypothetical protein
MSKLLDQSLTAFKKKYSNCEKLSKIEKHQNVFCLNLAKSSTKKTIFNLFLSIFLNYLLHFFLFKVLNLFKKLKKNVSRLL